MLRKLEVKTALGWPAGVHFHGDDLITVPDAARERILVEKDPERLERWLEKAAVAASVVEVIDEPS